MIEQVDQLFAHVLQLAGIFHGDVGIRNFLSDTDNKMFGICDLGNSAELGQPAEFWAGDLLHSSSDQIMASPILVGVPFLDVGSLS